MYDAGRVTPRSGPGGPTDGVIDRSHREIRLRVTGPKSHMVHILLHEMAHAATNGFHGIKWTFEMIRLRDLGAPIDTQDLWAPGDQVWRIIEKARVGEAISLGVDDLVDEATSVSEEHRLRDAGCTQKELELLTALHMIGPNRDPREIEEVASVREEQLQRRKRRAKQPRSVTDAVLPLFEADENHRLGSGVCRQAGGTGQSTPRRLPESREPFQPV